MEAGLGICSGLVCWADRSPLHGEKNCVRAKFKYKGPQGAGRSARQSSSALEAGTGDLGQASVLLCCIIFSLHKGTATYTTA